MEKRPSLLQLSDCDIEFEFKVLDWNEFSDLFDIELFR